MIKTFNVEEVVEKQVVRFGNGSIVYAPKRWIGKKVLIVLEQKPLNIAENVMDLLKPHLSSIQGVFLYGSFARGEQTPQSDIDVLVIADKMVKLKKAERFDFLVKTKKEFVDEMKKDFTLFLYNVVREAKPIFNKSLLEELREARVKPNFGKLFDSTLCAFKKVREILDAEKRSGKEFLESGACIYSLILRLRGLVLAQCYLEEELFSRRKLRNVIKSHGFQEEKAEEFLQTYAAERDDKKTVHKIALPEAEKLFGAVKAEFLKTEGMVKAWVARKNTRRQSNR